MELTLRRASLRLRTPLPTAYGVIEERELIEVALIDAEGRRGRGEAAPLEAYDGVSLARVQVALEAYRGVVAEPPAGILLLDACRAVDALPQALAAIDMALWDLGGQRAGQPVCRMLTDAPAEQIEVNASVGALDPARAADAAATAVALGYTTVKLKVGVGDDVERVAAVREAIGPEPALRLDANGAWTLAQAERMLGLLAPFGLELVEEPVRGLEDTRTLRARVPVRIAIDETAATPGALTAHVADAVCLKIGRCGGIGGLLAAASLVRASGAEVYLSSTYDGPTGTAAALHAAAALAPLPACGLATLELFADPPQELRVSAGAIRVPGAPGLGI